MFPLKDHIAVFVLFRYLEGGKKKIIRHTSTCRRNNVERDFSGNPKEINVFTFLKIQMFLGNDNF